MTWFRSKRGGIAWLAGMALAVQLFASFGHSHFNHAIDAASVFALADNDGGPQPQKERGGHGHVCAICITIATTAASVIPTPPAAAAPVTFRTIALQWTTAAEPAERSHTPFHARGPPLA